MTKFYYKKYQKYKTKYLNLKRIEKEKTASDFEKDLIEFDLNENIIKVGNFNDKKPFNYLKELYTEDSYEDKTKYTDDNNPFESMIKKEKLFVNFKDYTIDDLYYLWYVQDGCTVGTLNRWGKVLLEDDLTDDNLKLIFNKVYDSKAEYIPEQKYSEDPKYFSWINAMPKRYNLTSNIHHDSNIEKLLLINGIKTQKKLIISESENVIQKLFYGFIEKPEEEGPLIIFIYVKTNRNDEECIINCILGYEQYENIYQLYIVPSYKLNAKINDSFSNLIQNHIDSINKVYGDKNYRYKNEAEELGKILYGDIEFYHIHIVKRRNCDEFLFICHQKVEDNWGFVSDKNTNINCKKQMKNGLEYKEINNSKILSDKYMHDSKYEKYRHKIRSIHNSIVLITKNGYLNFTIDENYGNSNTVNLFDYGTIGITDDIFGDKIASLNFRNRNNIYLTNEYSKCSSKICEKIELNSK